MRYLTIALTKGRLAYQTLELLEKVGITCDEMKNKRCRKLDFTDEEHKLRFFLAKGPDVPTYVEYGAADIGIVGKDTILEEGRRLYEVLDLGYGKCRMCVCGPESARELLQHNQQIRVATKYPNIAKDYFYNRKHQTVEMIKLNGSIELAPIVGLSEVIVDIVETGSTLRENGLTVLEEVCPLSARMAINQVSMRMENERITKLIQDLKESTGMRIVKLTKRDHRKYSGEYAETKPDTVRKRTELPVQEIIENVKIEKDAAVFEYTEKFDHAVLDASTVEVTQEEIDEAYNIVDPELIAVIRRSMKNIREFHEKQKQNSWFTSTENGTMLGQKLTALNRVGVYVPGGKAAYPSSVLMNILPAKVAGVKEICMTTPCGRDGKVNPVVLAAAKEAGADRVFKIGGAQAIAALAYGTESIPKVDKIVGPGNIYVALAKKAVYGNVSIDSIAGPSEILVLADETANPRFVAADLLSQAEHDELVRDPSLPPPRNWQRR